MTQESVSKQIDVKIFQPTVVMSADDLGPKVTIAGYPTTLNATFENGLSGTNFIYESKNAENIDRYSSLIAKELKTLYGNPDKVWHATTDNGEIVYLAWKRSGVYVYLTKTSLLTKKSSINYGFRLLPNKNDSIKIDAQTLAIIPDGGYKELAWHGLSVIILKRTESQMAKNLKNRLRGKYDSKNYLSESLSTSLNAIDVEKDSRFSKDLRSIQDNYGIYISISPYKGCHVNFLDHDSTRTSDTQIGLPKLLYDPCARIPFDSTGMPTKLGYSIPLLVPPHYYADNGDLIIGVSSNPE